MNPNWNYVPFDDIFKWKAKSKIKSGDGLRKGPYKLFVSSDIEVKRYTFFLETTESLVFGTGGKASCHYVNEPFAYSTDCIVAQKKSKEIFTKFYYYFLREKQLEKLAKTFTGSGLQHTSKKKIGCINVPVPPLPEQERIVAKIEELFSQLDRSISELQNAKRKLNTYKKAIIAQEFTFSNANDSSPIKFSPLREFIEPPKYGTSKKCNYAKSESKTSVIRIPNIDSKNGIIDKEDLKFAKFTDSELNSFSLQDEDLLVIRSNGSVSIVGTAAIVRPCDTSSVYAGYLIRIRILNKEKLLPKYLLYYLSSNKARNYIENTAKSTSGVNNINSKEIANLEIPITDVKNQKEIVNRIEHLLLNYVSIEQTIDNALQQAEALRQSILKEAFEGRL